MSLAQYRKKRRFKETPEPRGTEKPKRAALRFVVQKHAASHLHYDFRLELDGTLKSWAVPKGPSLSPKDRRLAIMVEDHPLDYRTFEGVIPAGNYGAGTVMVWDEGTYCSRESADRTESERILRAGLDNGHLTFVLNGQKLKGEFALVKIKRGKENEWLLIKKLDEWASSDDIALQDQSVATGRDLDAIAGGKEKRRRSTVVRPVRGIKPRKEPERNGARHKMPHHIKPMLASLVEAPFDKSDWLFEVKWDGYRAIAEVSRKDILLYSRSDKSFADRFPAVVESLRCLGHDAVLDGEIIVTDARGRSDFQLLQNYQKTGQGRLSYCVFDLLYLDGHDLRAEPLRERKQLLDRLVAGVPGVFISEHVEEEGIAFFNAAVAQSLEGIVAKDARSPYREGLRSQAWLKIKTHRRQEAVICGFTEPRGSRKHLGALLLGVYDDDELIYIGHTRGRLDAAGLSDLRHRLEPLIQRTCPFARKPHANAPVHWVKPRLVCEVSFQEWTHDGIMRLPIFIGLREDKPARSVHRELPERMVATDVEAIESAVVNSPAVTTRTNGQRRAGTTPPEPNLTHLDKIYWPEEGFTKGDLINYYREIASVMLPYLRDRPESLHRHPNGIAGTSFFQKDVGKQKLPEWVETTTIASEGKREKITYLLCQNQATLLYLAKLGCIEVNPWNSRIGALDRPDYLVIDLDPEDVPFAQVIEAAVSLHKILDRAGAESCCKTSGKRGLHVFVPLGAQYSTEQARQFAEVLANIVHQSLSASTSILRKPALRQHRVYLDYLQNRRGQTLASPYSVRPYPGATVSAPLRWAEVKRGLDPAKFTMETLPRRLDRLGDLWKPVLGPGINLSACLERVGHRTVGSQPIQPQVSPAF